MIFYFDIEMVPLVQHYYQLNDRMKGLWNKKHQRFDFSEPTVEAESFEQKAGLYPEFGKIVCISVGYWKNENFVCKSYTGEEKEILNDFFSDMESVSSLVLCGHNIKGFDIPFVCKRSLINGVEIPRWINVVGRKPWEIPHIDTMEMWKFGDMRNFTSLDTIAAVLGIESSKDEMDGSMVGVTYWNDENGIEKIITYCEADVQVTAKVHRAITSGML